MSIDITQKTQPKRPRINQGELLERFKDEDVYVLQKDVRLYCQKCDKFRFHDIYGTVAGETIITLKSITHCRDCGFEVQKDIKPIGKVG